jgi:hypothetical protein
MVLRYTIYIGSDIGIMHQYKKNTLQKLGEDPGLTLHNFFLQFFFLDHKKKVKIHVRKVLLTVC